MATMQHACMYTVNCMSLYNILYIYTCAQKAFGILGCAEVLTTSSWTMKKELTSISDKWAIAM